MRRTSIVVVAGALVLGLGAVPAAAAPASMTIVTRDAFVTRIGTFRPSENPRVSAAVRAFGRPTSRRARGSACTVRWRGLGLKIVFASFDSPVPGRTTCSSSVGRAQSFVAGGARFTTVLGLRPGQPSTQIRALYPDTRFERGAWTLVSAVSPYGDGTESPVLRAFTKAGQVSALAGWMGAAGD